MEGFAKIGIDIPLLVAFVVSFVVLFALLGVFLYKPVLKMLDERSKRIKEGMERAEATKQEYEQVKVNVEEQIDKSRQEGQAIIAQASEIAGRLKEEAREEARQEAQAIVDRTRAELERERDKLVGDLRKEFVDVAVLAAEKVINETLDKKRHRRLIEEVLERSDTFRKN
ncbi:MAG: F0F1 ATP synthase subunit B [Chloroflexota bacterium]|nr:F0F1 ATP synthase subunit B [Chloroflexota bacterium]